MRASRQCDIGVSCVSVHPDDPGTAVLGTEGGVVVVANLDSLVELAGEGRLS